jgi:cell division protein FtsI (penicillin-binding protein 3)
MVKMVKSLSKKSQGQWKPIRDINEVDPQDRYDISTEMVYIKTHHALLKQLEDYELITAAL